MWNAWSKEECQKVFGWEWEYFWEKWCGGTKETPRGGAEKFYAELTEDNREKLVNRACELYDRGKRLF